MFIPTYVFDTISTKVILNLTNTIRSIYDLILSINNESKQIEQLIIKSDIKVIIETLELYINEIDTDLLHTSKTLTFSLKNLHDIIDTIKTELERIHYKIQYNKNVYLLYSIRAYGFNSSFERMENYMKTLEIRKNLLFDVIKGITSIDTFDHPKPTSTLKNTC
jgi:hypothetical protein